MIHTTQIERRRDRRELAKQAGFGSVSWVSVLAGTLAAYGLTAALLAVAGGIAAGINGSRDFSGASTTDLKVTTGIIVAVVLFLSFLFGGYVAGRMARRSGTVNGLGVFVLGVALAVGIGVWVKEAGAGPSLAGALRHTGAPTTWHEWRTVGIIAGAAALAAMLVGSMIGGIDGERWHTKLTRRALDPAIGPDAGARASLPVEREAPAVERPVEGEVASPVAERPVAERPIEREPAGPMAERAVAERPVSERPVAERPVAERPIEREPAAPVAEDPETVDGSRNRRGSWRHLLHH